MTAVSCTADVRAYNQCDFKISLMTDLFNSNFAFCSWSNIPEMHLNESQ